MKTIGIKLADGSFYPVLEEGSPKHKKLDLTTAHDKQTKVMVDLYRSSSCSMEDAEYVDSLQIENLNAHPTGETNISFEVAIDENNELSAYIADPETGKESNTTITLVSRTIEERLVTDEYNISESKVAKAGGLLAMASALRGNEKEEPKQEDDIVSEPVFEVEETQVSDEEVSENNEDSLPDFNFEEDTTSTETTAEPENFDLDDDNLSLDEQIVSQELSENPDFSFEENITDDIFASTEAPTEETDVFASEDSSADTDIFASSETSSEETDVFKTDDAFAATETDVFNTDEPTEDFSFDSETSSSDTIEASSEDIFAETEASTEEPVFDDDNIVSDEDSLPDFNFDEDANTTETESTSFDLGETTTVEDSTLPDFNFDEEESTDNSEDPLADFNLDDTTSDSTEFEETDLPDFNFDDDTTSTESDDFFSDNSTNDIPSGGGISFTGLYDKETALGESANYDDEDTSKKTRAPVIICIICAIICIIATLLILFIIPSKYNLISRPKKDTAVETPVVETPKEEPAPVVQAEPDPVPEAKEDEIVIIEKAEEVVPSQPPVVEEKPKNITYKIKWGDTLWDISDTYYKNPWRYKYIARYNGIKDPDYIISGTTITIPAE